MDPKIEDLKNKIKKLETEIKSAKNKNSKNQKVKNSENYVPEKTLYKWATPSRVFIKRNKTWFLTISAIALVLILFFAFLQDPMVILVICVVVLIAFLLGSIPPKLVKHKITNKGVFSIDRLFKWEDLNSFWVAQKDKWRVLYIETNIRMPGRLVLLLRKKDEEEVVKLLGARLEYKDLPEKQGWVSKKSDGIAVKPSEYAHLFDIAEKPKEQKTKKAKQNKQKKKSRKKS